LGDSCVLKNKNKNKETDIFILCDFCKLKFSVKVMLYKQNLFNIRWQILKFINFNIFFIKLH